MSFLKSYQMAAGAIADPHQPHVPASFGNDGAALVAATTGVGVVDRSHWSRLMLGGADRQRFLHNQSTADIAGSPVGSVIETVFVNATGRTIDLATVLVLPAALGLLFSPGQAQPMLELLDRYVFPADQVTLTNATDTWTTFTTIGPRSDALVAAAGIDLGAGYGSGEMDGMPLVVAQGNGLGLPGQDWWVPIDRAAELWSWLLGQGAIPMGDRVWQELRLLQGRPAWGQELTLDYNPLEAGLWQTISFSKGCYIGQETIARLNTYKGVKQYLWGISLSQAVPLGSPLMLGGEKVGVLTSCGDTELGCRGLAYVKSKVGGVGLRVQVAEAEGEILALPYISHDYPA
jgi:tRNA-modifying protein YgfZ